MESSIWEYLFDNENLALRLHEATSANSDGLTFHSNEWGVVKVKAQVATAPGDNFTSDAYAVQVTTETNGKSVHRSFVKVLPRLPMLFTGALSQGLYNREISIYKILHSKLCEIRDHAGIHSSSLPLACPQHYYSLLDETGPCGSNRTAVVLEDLKPLGFRTIDKRFGNPAKEAFLAIEALARYHAMTIALIEKEWRTAEGSIVPPENLRFTMNSIEYHEKNYDTVGIAMHVWVLMARERIGPQLGDWLDHEYRTNGKKALTPETYETCEPLVCILHADCWSNNIMFNYAENEEPTDVRIVDWQITRLGHPAIDILQYLFTSTTTDTRREHLIKLLDKYYDTLEDSLALIGCRILIEKQYTKQRFLQDVHQRLRFALFMSLVVLPVILDDSVFKAIVASRSNQQELQNNSSEIIMTNPTAGVEKIRKYLTVEKMLSNELLYSRIVDTISEIQLLIEKKSFI